MEVIRSYVNESRKKYLLLQNNITFDQLIVCLDTIEDAEEAITEFLSGNQRFYYLSIYGIFQALIIQQDAVKYLNKALCSVDINLIKEYPELDNIRKVRNLAVGHPTKNHYKTFNQISRISIKNNSFSLLKRYENGGSSLEEIDINDLILKQKEFVGNDLTKIIKIIREDYNQHKKRFEMNNLTDLIPKSINYNITKLYEGRSSDREIISIVQINLDVVQDTVQKVKDGVIERYESLEAILSLKYLFEKIEFILNKLSVLYATSSIDDLEVEIYVDACKMQMQELFEIAQNIDEEFKN